MMSKVCLRHLSRDDNLVIFIEHKMIYLLKGDVPEEEYTIPFGVADIKSEGKDVTIVAYSNMVYKALEAAAELEKEGISAKFLTRGHLYRLMKKLF